MSNEEKIKQIKKEIDRLYENKNVSKQESADDIQEIIDYCKILISALEI